MLHNEPLKVWLGAASVILLQLALPLALVAAPLLVLSDQLPERFSWVPRWFIAFPLAVPVFGLGYLLVSTSVRCKICTQKLFTPRHCRKNQKAHHVPGLGYIFPLALHVLTFKWFNCMFCGTSVRIKE